MAIHDFTIGRIRRADYVASARQLILDFDDGSRRVYTAVPEEVFRRLCHAPNPTTYWEDRIAEEYPQVRVLFYLTVGSIIDWVVIEVYLVLIVLFYVI